MNDIRICDVQGVTAEYIDCCISCYFNGSTANEVLAVPMYSNITFKEALDAAIETFHTSSGYFDEVSGSGDMVEHALHTLFSEVKDINSPADFARGIENNQGENDETVYLYIALIAN